MVPTMLRACLLALLSVLAVVPTASAQASSVPRVIVLRFAGPRADAARERVMIEIASYVELVDEEQAVITAEEMGVDVSTPEGMAEVVVAMGISLVVAGSVDGRRGPTTITVVNPQGEALASETAPNPRDDRGEIARAAVAAIQAAQAELRRREEEAAAAEEAEAAARARAEAQAREAAAAQRLDPPEEDEPEEPLGGWRQPVVSALAGLRLRAQTTDALAADGSGPFFATDAYPEIDLQLAVRPLAGANDLSRGLYLGAQGAFSVGITYLGELGDTRDMTSFRFRFDAGFGYSGDIFEIVGMVGVGVDGVSLDQSDGFSSILFTYLRPGILARFRAVEDYLQVEMGLGGRIGLDGGELPAAYGPGLTFGGVDLFAGVAGVIEGFTYAVRLGYAYMALGFDGMGGAIFDADSGTDESIEGRFLLGYSFL